MTLVLNPKAKEQQEQRRKAILAGDEEPIIILKTPLWENIRKYLPEERLQEIHSALLRVLIEDCPIEWDKSNLDNAMVWDDTPQGYDYWSAIHKICMNNGILHGVVWEIDDEND